MVQFNVLICDQKTHQHEFVTSGVSSYFCQLVITPAETVIKQPLGDHALSWIDEETKLDQFFFWLKKKAKQ